MQVSGIINIKHMTSSSDNPYSSAAAKCYSTFESLEVMYLMASLINKRTNYKDGLRFATMEQQLFESLSAIHNGHEWQCNEETGAALIWYKQKSVIHLLSLVTVHMRISGANTCTVSVPNDFPEMTLLKQRLELEFPTRHFLYCSSNQESEFKFLSTLRIRQLIDNVLDGTTRR